MDRAGKSSAATKLPSVREYITLPCNGAFDAYKTFECGQCFRFERVSDDGARGGRYGGVAMGRYVEIEAASDGVRVYGAPDCEAAAWSRYLGLDCDYDALDCMILSRMTDETTAAAVASGRGIRILRQQPWEALCSFIISQNNNIPRIKKIIAAMSEKYGAPISRADGSVKYAFPEPDALADAGVDGIFALRTGFRACYIYDAALKVTAGKINLDAVDAMDYTNADAALRQIKGVGPKVSACALLYGFGKTEAFPVDVWIRRVLDRFYGGSIDTSALGCGCGIFQQYLFWYIRGMEL